jgi:hypothetical protein
VMDLVGGGEMAAGGGPEAVDALLCDGSSTSISVHR